MLHKNFYAASSLLSHNVAPIYLQSWEVNINELKIKIELKTLN